MIRLLILLFLFTPTASAETIETKLSDTTQIISCIQKDTLEIREPKNGKCFYGTGWQNISVPPEEQLKEWRKVFETDAEIINRLPVVNFESGFNPNASNKHAIGYVQTLRKWNIDPDIIPQLQWMKDRMESQKVGNCSQWKEESRLLRCLYARHYGADSGYHWYPNKAMKARSVYLSYFYR